MKVSLYPSSSLGTLGFKLKAHPLSDPSTSSSFLNGFFLTQSSNICLYSQLIWWMKLIVTSTSLGQYLKTHSHIMKDLYKFIKPHKNLGSVGLKVKWPTEPGPPAGKWSVSLQTQLKPGGRWKSRSFLCPTTTLCLLKAQSLLLLPVAV